MKVFTNEAEAQQDRMRVAEKRCKTLTTVLKACEAFDAGLILTDETWDDGLPHFTQDQYDRWVEIQDMRNAALKEERE